MSEVEKPCFRMGLEVFFQRQSSEKRPGLLITVEINQIRSNKTANEVVFEGEEPKHLESWEVGIEVEPNGLCESLLKQELGSQDQMVVTDQDGFELGGFELLQYLAIMLVYLAQNLPG